MRDCVLALDVGGTFIKGAAVWGNGEVAKETLLYRNTNAQGARDAVLDQLHAAVKELAVRAKAVAGEDGIRVQGIGLAFRDRSIMNRASVICKVWASSMRCMA